MRLRCQFAKNRLKNGTSRNKRVVMVLSCQHSLHGPDQQTTRAAQQCLVSSILSYLSIHFPASIPRVYLIPVIRASPQPQCSTPPVLRHCLCLCCIIRGQGRASELGYSRAYRYRVTAMQAFLGGAVDLVGPLVTDHSLAAGRCPARPLRNASA